MPEIFSPEYWEKRYQDGRTGWDVGAITPPLKRIIDGIENKSARILIPGGGQSYAAEYAFNQGFTNTFVCDWSSTAFNRLREVLPAFPIEQMLIQDFFTVTEQFDYIVEQTFFCALPPSLRRDYVEKTAAFLHPQGVLTGVLFDFEFSKDGPPFGGSEKEYRQLFKSHYQIEILESCQDSIPPRMGNELFLRALKI